MLFQVICGRVVGKSAKLPSRMTTVDATVLLTWPEHMALSLCFCIVMSTIRGRRVVDVARSLLDYRACRLTV